MMLQSIGRKGATSGGFSLSFAIHGGLFLLLAMLMRMGPDGVDQVVDELTEIAYIEARYGEDVAKQVRMKTKPIVQPEPEKVVEQTVQEEAKPEQVAEAKPKEPEYKMAEPTLKSKTRLQPRKAGIETRSMLKPKKMADIDAPKLSAKQRQQFSEITTKSLDNKRFKDPKGPGIDTSNLRNRNQLAAADISAPKLESRQAQASSFQSKDVALVGKKSNLDLNDVEFEVSKSGKSSGRMAMQLATGGSETGNAALVGGRLEEGQTAYQGSVAALLPTEDERRAQRAAVDVDLAEPALQKNNKGRRTLLDYGSGDGGVSSSLKSRTGGGIAEAPKVAAIVQQETTPKEAETKLAETTTSLKSSKGVSMTVSGQITGRKILQSINPEYSTEARQKGWEGVVAVHFTVKPNGEVKKNMYFEQTSAHRDLNRAAMDAIQSFVFEPLSADNRVEQWGVITIVFRLS
jgi:TonB family protein